MSCEIETQLEFARCVGTGTGASFALPSALRPGAMAPRASRAGGRVFATVGTTSFDALVEALDSPSVLDALASAGHASLTIQVGRGAYRPSRGARSRPGFAVDHFDFRPSLDEAMRGASLVISHAGAGSIFEALALRVPLLVVVNETLMDNHQVELAKELERRGYLRWCVPETLEEAVRAFDASELVPYEPGDPRELARAIDELLF
jgi:beta-1,4-N-acetylglucosaminyltransferase